MPQSADLSTRGLHLTRSDEDTASIDALADLLGGRVGLDGVLDDLDRRARRGLAPGLAARHALTWDREDRRTTRWWPQGISSSSDASETETVGGRRVVVVSWYAKESDGEAPQGSRLTFLDLDTRRYRHVLLVTPTPTPATDGSVRLEPLRVHAGGLVWCGPWLHVAATGRGFLTCHVDDLLHVPDEMASGDTSRLAVDGDRVSSFGYRYLLPVRLAHRAGTEEGHERLRYSCLSLDRSTTPPELLVGEYGRGDKTRRLARFALAADSLLPAVDEDGLSRPRVLDERGVPGTQGAVVVGGDWFLTVSHGPMKPGSVYVGRPGAFRRRRWATPMGPEDLTYWPSTDTLWSVTEHPRRRWIFAMRRSRLT
ncbi:hypothetical protein GCM10009844_42810 [Nocardioides koreensis]|uniref:Uncharacterized protein n=1 Tax=Nocardioides koreensis TaxID=433651 RepID=A0ABN3A8A8_9ACTN